MPQYTDTTPVAAPQPPSDILVGHGHTTRDFP